MSERIPTGVLVAQARAKVALILGAYTQTDTADLLTELAAALEARDRRIAELEAGTERIAEVADRRIAELEAGLRDAADYLQAASVAADDHGDAVFSSDLHRAALAARDLLAGRAAGDVEDDECPACGWQRTCITCRGEVPE